MAVIQDLPPELLIRILELHVAEWMGSAPAWATLRARLSHLALVARSWKGPAQELLISLFSTDNSTSVSIPVFDRFLHLMSSPNVDPRCMRRLVLLPGASSSSQLALLAQRNVKLQELRIFISPITFTARHAKLIQRLRRLEMNVPVSADSFFYFSSKMSLETLSVSPFISELPFFLFPLSEVAPMLTRLELTRVEPDHSGTGPIRAALDIGLQQLAPRLRSLTLQFPWSVFDERWGWSLKSFLPACTSLVALEVEGLSPAELFPMLALVPNQLQLLQTHTFFADLELAVDWTMECFATIFDLPSMAQLKRWRMTIAGNYGHDPTLQSALDKDVSD
ncbi:hypothetical protein BCR35DRAFT_335980 [Leucosporidium creatinivorum]|uniref:F-box domain-containing protein n=1 Tax=Leucosporidium creatinivorum TaxID=106004 RepID=A0A1Y2CYU5_9BASI|nr:hypothetical protein BCR35DRAFT_335980 [Leucosporidium creatinivorum]